MVHAYSHRRDVLGENSFPGEIATYVALVKTINKDQLFNNVRCRFIIEE